MQSWSVDCREELLLWRIWLTQRNIMASRPRYLYTDIRHLIDRLIILDMLKCCCHCPSFCDVRRIKATSVPTLNAFVVAPYYVSTVSNRMRESVTWSEDGLFIEMTTQLRFELSQWRRHANITEQTVPGRWSGTDKCTACDDCSGWPLKKQIDVDERSILDEMLSVCDD